MLRNSFRTSLRTSLRNSLTTSFNAISIAILILVVGGCASSGNSREPSEAEVAAALANKDEKADPMNQLVCRRERETGTHFTRKVCRTKRQMQEEEQNAQRLMDQNRTLQGSSGEG